MPESSLRPVIPDPRSCPTAFIDLDGGASEEQRIGVADSRRIRPPQRAYRVVLRNIRQPNLTMTSIRVGESHTSVDLWYVDLDVPADVLSCFRQWLSHDELATAARFHSDLHRARYTVGRATLRCLLADRIGRSPAAIRFSYGKNGKPMLEGSRANVEFNVAHSGGDAVIALVNGAAVGVDIELLRPIAEVESLARLAFSDVERHELQLAP